MNRLLTMLTCMVLTVLCAAGTAQAGGFFHFGNDGAKVGDGVSGSCENAIWHCEVNAPSNPGVVDSLFAWLDAATADHLVKLYLYNEAGTVVVDSTVNVTITAVGGYAWVGGVAQARYAYSPNEVMNIAVWGQATTGDATAAADSNGWGPASHGDTAWIMISQTFGQPAPTLSDQYQAWSGTLVSRLTAYAVYRDGNAIISGTTDVEDVNLSDGGLGTDNYNFGASTTSQIDTAATTNCDYFAIRAKNVAARVGPSKVIDTCIMWMYISPVTVADSLLFFELLQNWVEGTQTGAACTGGATWLEFVCDLDSAWGTEGAALFGTDIVSPRAAGVLIGVAGWYGFDITELARRWYAGTTPENGGLFRHEPDNPGLDVTAYTSENAANRPYFSFYTSNAAADGINPRRRRLLSGGSQ